MRGELVSAPAATDSVAAFNVTLVTLPRVSDAPASSAKSLDVLAAALKSDALPIYLSEAGGDGRLETLSARLRPAGADSSQSIRPARTAPPWPQPPAPQPVDEARHQTPGRTTAKAADGQAGASASSGGLWGRIEPCWRTSANRSKVPVTLEVAIDGSGNLSKPPRILRDAAGNDERQLAAEAAALAALSACLPRGDVAFGNRIYRLEFRPE